MKFYKYKLVKNLIKMNVLSAASFLKRPLMLNRTFPTAASTTFFNTPAMMMFATAEGKAKRRESLRAREDRRKGLAKLMESW